MSFAVVQPGTVSGMLTPPPSKSAAHRALICAALAGGGTVNGVLPSEDMRATLRAVQALGTPAEITGTQIHFSARRPLSPSEQAPVTVDCGESGSTLRFFIPLFAAMGIDAVFTGSGRLPQRPLGVYADCLPVHGVDFTPPANGGSLPLRVAGRLRGGEYALPGNVSSQFITGLLFALPLCQEDSVIRLTSPLESAGYVDMTLAALQRAGITVETTADGWRIPGGQAYRPADYTVEADWSQAAFLLAAGALAGNVRLQGLSLPSAQGDSAALALFRRFGADIATDAGGIRCRRAPLHGIDINAAQIPDLVPILAVTAAFAEGVTHIFHAERLRIKESDRLAATADGLRRLGARVEETADGLRIHGGGPLTGGEVDGCNDHRIVMSMAVAALRCSGPVTISDAQSVAKSWPGFFIDFIHLGGNAHVFDHR